MKVYTLLKRFEEWSEDGWRVEAIFSTVDGAKEAMKKLKLLDTNWNWRFDTDSFELDKIDYSDWE